MKSRLLAATLLGSCTAALYAQTRPVRIMPLGDSITQGDDHHNTYRRPLWHKLVAAGYNVDFVGTWNYQFGYGPPPNPDFDTDHQGDWGREAWAVLNQVQNYAQATHPDIVLIHLGTNDVHSGRPVSEAIDSLSQIIDKLRLVNPSVTILLASVIPIADSYHDLIQQLAAAIPLLAARKNTAASLVLSIDQNTGFDAQRDTYDGTHPSEGGEEKLASKWFAGLASVLGAAVQPGTAAPTLITNSASLAKGPVAPGEIVTLFGSWNGPDTPANLRLNAAGLVDSVLGEMRVLFDGVAAPLTYSSRTQVNAVVPYSVAGKTSTSIQVEFRGVRSNAVDQPVTSAAPGLFTLSGTGSGPAAAVTPEGAPNSPQNPAAVGSFLSFYATGEGQTNPGGQDGAVNGVHSVIPVLPVSVSFSGADAEVFYAGGSPGLVSGVLQVNVQVPAGLAPGSAVPVTVKVGGVPCQAGVTVAIR